MTRPDALARVQAQHAPTLARCPTCDLADPDGTCDSDRCPGCDLAACECCHEPGDDEPMWDDADEPDHNEHCDELVEDDDYTSSAGQRRDRPGRPEPSGIDAAEYDGPMPQAETY